MFSMIYEFLEKLVSRVAAMIKKVNGVSPKPDGDITYKAINLLDNSNFADPLNQNGKQIYACPMPSGGSRRTIDRWVMYNNMPSVDEMYGLEVHDGYISFTGDALHYLQQVVRKELTSPYAFPIVTFAVGTIEGDVYTVSGYPAYAPTKDGLYIRQLSLKNGDKGIAVQIRRSGNFAWAALYEEIGYTEDSLPEGMTPNEMFNAETLPPYIPKSRAEEQLECRRMYFKKTYRNLVCSVLSTTELMFTIDIGMTPMASEPAAVSALFLDNSVKQITFYTNSARYTIDLSGTRTCTIENYTEGATTLQIKLTSSIAMTSTIVNRVGYIDGLTFVLNCEV